MKLTKKLQAEIRREMNSCRDCHTLFDTEDGTIYWDFNYEKGGFEAGGACNWGLIPEFFHAYEPSDTFQANIEDFYAAAQEHFNINE